jgi:peptidylprolyl isomerase
MSVPIALLLAGLALGSATTRAAEPENMLYLDLASGRVTIELLPEVAPQHVARIKELARAGSY